MYEKRESGCEMKERKRKSKKEDGLEQTVVYVSNRPLIVKKLPQSKNIRWHKFFMSCT